MAHNSLTYLTHRRPVMPLGKVNAPSHGAHKPLHASAGEEVESVCIAHSKHMDHDTRGSGEVEAKLENSETHDHHTPEGSDEGLGEEGVPIAIIAIITAAA